MNEQIDSTRCWVCSTVFTEYGGTAQREVHHIIPVAYGGKNGPTVALCDTHHSSLHKLAIAVRANKPHIHIYGTADTEQRRKLSWLASRVNTAQKATMNDPNKKSELLLQLTPEVKRKIDEISKITGVKGRENVLKYVLDSYYRSRFYR